MHIDDFKERLIIDGIASVKKNETRQERIDGGIEGFNLCRALNSPADFEECIASRNKVSHDMVSMQTWSEKERKAMYRDGMDVPLGRCKATVEDYWRYRYATIQIEFVQERMKVAWSQFGLYSGPLSARAVQQTAAILGVKDNDN